MNDIVAFEILLFPVEFSTNFFELSVAGFPGFAHLAKLKKKNNNN